MVILREILLTSSLNLQINTLLQDKNKEYDFTQFLNFILDSTDVAINMNGDASHEVPSYNDATGAAGPTTAPGPGSNQYAAVPSAPPPAPTGDLPPPPSYDEVYGTYIYRQLVKEYPKNVLFWNSKDSLCICLSQATIMQYCKIRILSVPVSKTLTCLFLCLRGES